MLKFSCLKPMALVKVYEFNEGNKSASKVCLLSYCSSYQAFVRRKIPARKSQEDIQAKNGNLCNIVSCLRSLVNTASSSSQLSLS